MGCFSYLCKVCDDPINVDDTGIGEHCTLYLLENGRVIEEMTGQYNNYGCVYKDKGLTDPENLLNLLCDAEWHSYDWSGICDLNFSRTKNCGIAAVHTDCLSLLSTSLNIKTQSEDAENQGNGAIKHITEGKFSYRVIEKTKTKTPIIPDEIERNKKDNILMAKLSKEIAEIDIKLKAFLEKHKNKNKGKN